jgi:hypothetical protein
MKVASLILICFALTWLAVSSSAQSQPSLGYVKQLDDGSYLITVDGEQHWAVNLAKVKQIKKNEIELQRLTTVEIPKLNDSLVKEKANVQDERLRVGQCETRYAGQVALSGECFALLKKGGGKFNSFLEKPVVKLIRDVAPSAVQIATCK